MCLSDANWSILFLSFRQLHMQNDHQNLSKYSDEVDTLFEQIVASVNADSEIAKLRTSMSHITRKPGESIQTPLYRLKTCYEMLIQINYPDLDVEKINPIPRGEGHICPPTTFRQFSPEVLIRGGSNYTLNLSFAIT